MRTELEAASTTAPTTGTARNDAADQRRLAIGAVRVLALLAVPVAAIAATFAGWQGVISSLIGLGLVLILFGASAMLLSWVSERATGPAGVMVLAVGAVLRIMLYLGILFGLNQMDWVHGRSLAGSTGLAIAVTLAYELRLLSQMQRLFWVDAAAGRPSVAANDTRSQPL